MFPSDDELLEMYGDVLENPAVRAVGGWQCANHDAPMDEASYIARAQSDLPAFSARLDEALKAL